MNERTCSRSSMKSRCRRHVDPSCQVSELIDATRRSMHPHPSYSPGMPNQTEVLTLLFASPSMRDRPPLRTSSQMLQAFPDWMVATMTSCLALGPVVHVAWEQSPPEPSREPQHQHSSQGIGVICTTQDHREDWSQCLAKGPGVVLAENAVTMAP